MTSNELLSVASETTAEDEVVIARGYKSRGAALAAFVPVAALFFTRDTAIIVAIGFSVLCGLVSFSEARLYDLCIRLKRTNVILGAGLPSYLEEHLKDISRRLFHISDALDAGDISKQKSNEREAQLQRRFDAIAAEREKAKNQVSPSEK